MRRIGFSTWLLCLFMTCGLSARSWAEIETDHLIYPLELERGLNLHGLVQNKGTGNGRSITDLEGELFWLTLRRGLIPHVIGGWDERLVNRCDDLDRGFTSMLDQAQESIDFMAWSEAKSVMVEAKQALSCDPTPVAVAEVARLHFLQGVLALEKGQEARRHFETALSIANDYAYPWDYSKAVQSAFESARQSVIARPFIPVQYADELAGLVITIDDRNPDHYGLSLRKGMHYLQLINEEGTVLRRGLIDIRFGPDGALPTVPSEELQPPSQAFVKAALMKQVESGQLDEDYAELIAHYLNKKGARNMTLIGGGASWRSLYRVRVTKNVAQRGGVISWP